jgi:8-oxo-dGTP pyrophosphatase MutT (NUDIX family)
MRVDRPAPGEELNTDGEVSIPRPAATVIVLRGGRDSLEVLMVKRNPELAFMGGCWVFPGGAVDADEGVGEEALRAAAVRELAEEAAIVGVDPAELVQFSRWITPRQVKRRFDAHFFLAPVPPGAEPRPDGRECIDIGWFTPSGALELYIADELPMAFPTIKHLEQLARFASATELLEYARDRPVVPIEPRIDVGGGEKARIILPGEPGYDD